MKLVLPARNLGSFRYLLGCICNTGVDGNKLSTTIFDKEGVTFTSFAHRQIFKRKSLSNPFEWENLCHQHELHSNQMHAQVINHGIPSWVMKDAIDSAEELFRLPTDKKMCFASADVHAPVRYGTSMNHVIDKVLFWRDFIKHYANPISEWIHLWPSDPPSYREKMGSYAKAANTLQKQLMEVIMESLGLNADYLHDDIEEGSQVMDVNCYPACPEPDLALGMPPHTDYGTLTILNQSQQGLQIMDQDKKWHAVPFVQGALIVRLGDQFEVLSNGRYKSIRHRAILDTHKQRLSIASIHSMPMEKKVGPAPELIDEQHPIAYKEGSFSGFLDHISVKSVSEEDTYLDTLKIHEA
ncbi:flavanone 3-dioxygenase 3 isoform X2 [Lactuca sativa]|uniref:flavanone 3-dioxygenase 3 isoform X2 n=1 Tax=Lactuca sativa TaxID=4236 RepID=UPI001C689ACA|nr:flavanone 3-dioxygenase 3 isoform X2 [Lactuca sativa]